MEARWKLDSMYGKSAGGRGRGMLAGQDEGGAGGREGGGGLAA